MKIVCSLSMVGKIFFVRSEEGKLRLKGLQRGISTKNLRRDVKLRTHHERFLAPINFTTFRGSIRDECEEKGRHHKSTTKEEPLAAFS